MRRSAGTGEEKGVQGATIIIIIIIIITIIIIIIIIRIIIIIIIIIMGVGLLGEVPWGEPLVEHYLSNTGFLQKW